MAALNCATIFYADFKLKICHLQEKNVVEFFLFEVVTASYASAHTHIRLVCRQINLELTKARKEEDTFVELQLLLLSRKQAKHLFIFLFSFAYITIERVN